MRGTPTAPLPSIAVLTAVLVGCGGMETTFRVPGGGMEPAIAIGQTIEVDRGSYRSVADVQRGDIVVFRMPSGGASLFVKRVVALPGETVSVKEGRVSIDGVPLGLRMEGITGFETAGQATYRVMLSVPCGGASDDTIVPANALYVLGDNRCASLDSRRFGTVSFGAVEGQVRLQK